jgi:hypothetical protein
MKPGCPILSSAFLPLPDPLCQIYLLTRLQLLTRIQSPPSGEGRPTYRCFFVFSQRTDVPQSHAESGLPRRRTR